MRNTGILFVCATLATACADEAASTDGGTVMDARPDSATAPDTAVDVAVDAPGVDSSIDRERPLDAGPAEDANTSGDAAFDAVDGAGDVRETEVTADGTGSDVSTEFCNGLDDDGNGLIDDRPSCWTTIYRFQTSTGGALEARCLGPSMAVPSQCAGYVYEREAFIVPSTMIPGRTFPARQCSRLTDHIVVDERSTDRTVLEGAGYDCGLRLGYPFLPGMAPVGRETTFPYACDLFRFRYTAGSTGAHLFTTGTDSTTGLTCEPPARAQVMSTTACFASRPSGC